MACLVQQLFRQKIGKETDQGLIDEVLFPLLRSRKHGPRALLLDIKLTRSICTSRNALYANYNWRGAPPPPVVNISPFEKELLKSSAAALRVASKPPGKIPSSLRRRRHMSAWGTIEILNELRSLKHPNIDYFPPSNTQWDASPFEDVFIQFEEEASRPWHPPSRKNEAEFVNEFLEDALTKGKRLSFGGDPDINSHEKILSTYY
jgi:hypothetical protein